MKKFAKNSFIFFISFIAVSCFSSLEISKEELVNHKFGPGYQYNFNPDSSFALCLKNNKTPGKNALDFQLYDIEKDTVTFQAVFPGGNINWINNNQFEVNVIPGNINGTEKGSDLYFVYDVIENKIIKKDRK